jgi:hypothetical protein
MSVPDGAKVVQEVQGAVITEADGRVTLKYVIPGHGMIIFSCDQSVAMRGNPGDKIQMPPTRCGCGDCTAGSVAREFIHRGYTADLYVLAPGATRAEPCPRATRKPFARKLKILTVVSTDPKAVALTAVKN